MNSRDRTLAMRWLWTTAVMWLAVAAGAAHGHKASDAYVTIEARADTAPALRLDVALRDLDRELDLDANGDGQITWGEVRRRWREITQFVAAAVKVRRGSAACAWPEDLAPGLDEHTDGTYVVLSAPLICSPGAQDLVIEYRLFERTDPQHRALVRVLGREAGGATAGTETGGPFAQAPASASDITVLRPMAGWQTVTSPDGVPGAKGPAIDHAPAAAGFWHFATEGLHHIASGLDHVLFLTTLALVVVFRRDGSGPGPRWVAHEVGTGAVGEALKVVTAFTVAHSITLAMAVTGVAAPAARGVETVIAASVFIASIDNIWPLLPWPRWTMAGLFGLAHGFGFAGPLQSLGLSDRELVVPLVGFNLGVEAGQLAIVGLLLPLLVAWRDGRVYQRYIVPLASAAIASLALVWVVERAFDLRLIGI